jgi:hypothetical protein
MRRKGRKRKREGGKRHTLLLSFEKETEERSWSILGTPRGPTTALSSMDFFTVFFFLITFPFSAPGSGAAVAAVAIVENYYSC